MAQVFVSYAKADLARVDRVVRALEATGLSIFWDRVIPPGLRWRDVLGRELARASCVIVFWSKSSIDSNWVREEAGEGHQRDVLVPILLDAVTPPIGFREVHSLNLADWEGQEDDPSFLQLVGALEAKTASHESGSLANHPRLLPESAVAAGEPSAVKRVAASIPPTASSLRAPQVNARGAFTRVRHWRSGKIAILATAAVAVVAVYHALKRSKAPYARDNELTPIHATVATPVEDAQALSPPDASGGKSAISEIASASPPSSSPPPPLRALPKAGPSPLPIEIDTKNPYPPFRVP